MRGPLAILIIFSLALLSCGDLTGDDDSTGDDDDTTPQGPEDLAFAQILGGQGGPAFVIDGELYVVFGGQFLRMTNKGWDLVVDTSPGGLNCYNGYNIEVLGDRAYVLGGHFHPDGNCVNGQAGASAAVWVFDPQAATVTQGPDLLAAREVLASGVAGGAIWVIGGWDPANNALGINEPTVERFDGVAWADVPYSGNYTPIRSAAYAAVGDDIYLFGGCVHDEIPPLPCPCNSQYVQLFDTVTATFSQAPLMPLAGRHFSGQHAAARGDQIYVFGGSTGFSCTIFDDVARLDTTTGLWEILPATLTIERKSVGSALLGDELYVFGGLSCDPVLGCSALDECNHIGQVPDCPHAGAGANEVGVFF